MQEERLVINSSLLNMFRAFILPIFRSIRLGVTACSITFPRCWRPPTCVLYIGQAFHYSPENTFYIFNQQIYLFDRASMIQ